jgi:hypothetical protein
MPSESAEAEIERLNAEAVAQVVLVLDLYDRINARDARIAELMAALRPFEDMAVTEGRRPGLWRCPLCRQCSDSPHTIDHWDNCRAVAALKGGRR